MPFGDEHLGKAVAILRDSAGLSQKALAEKVDVKPNTMNQYERGRRQMSEEMILKIAAVIQRDPIEIWDMAYPIFRFNYFRVRAEREKIDLEALIAAKETPPSPVILQLHDCLTALAAAVLATARKESSIPGLVRVVVESPPPKSSKSRKTTGSGKKSPKSPKPR